MNELLYFGLFSVFLLPVFYFDIKEKRIPDLIIYPAIFCVLTFLVVVRGEYPLYPLSRAVGGFAYIWLFWLLKRTKIGLGDAKLSAYLCLGLGFPTWLLTLILGSLAALIYLLFIKLHQKKEANIPIAYGPFLCGAAVLLFFFRDHINSWFIPLWEVFR